MNIHKPMQLLIVAALLAACNGGGGGGGDRSEKIAGVWPGTFGSNVYLCIIFACVFDHVDTRTAFALAAPNGHFHLIPQDLFNLSGTQPYEVTKYVGRLRVSGNAVSGTLDRVGSTCLDNTGSAEYVYDQAVVDASVAAGVSLDGDWALVRCIGDGIFNLDYDAASEQPASPKAVSGLWQGGALVLDIRRNGMVTGSNSSGCQFTGSVAPVNTPVNIYEFEVTISNCRSSLAGPFDGLGTILPNNGGGRILVVSLTHRNQSATMVLYQ